MRKQNHVFAIAHPHLRESAFAGKVNAARVIWCALKGRAAEENSDCSEQSEDNGVCLKITPICFVIAKGDCGTLVFAIASK